MGVEAKLKKWYSKLKLNQALMLTFNVIFLIAVLAIVVTTVIVTGNITEDNYSKYTSQLLRGLSTHIEYITSDVEAMSLYVLSDENIQDVLTMDENSPQYDNCIRTARRESYRLIMERDYIETLAVYNFQGRGFTISSGPSYINDFSIWEQQEWFSDILEKEGKYLWVDSSFTGIEKEENRVIFGRVINKSDTQDGIGILLVMLNNRYLSKLVEEMSDPSIGDFYIQGKNRETLFGLESVEQEETLSNLSQSGHMKSGHKKSGKYYVTNSYLPHMEWNLLCVGECMVVMRSQWVNILIILIVTVLVICMASYIYSRLSHVITRELQNLNEVMERAKEQNFKEEIKLKRIYEFIQLGESYNRLIGRINVLVNEVMQEKLHTKQAQLENLQAQINPHFLYNTLNCINWKAMANGQEEISEMIQCLSRMFRFSLGKGEKSIELEKEIDNIRDYLLLQKKRFEEKLIYLIDVQESVQDYRVIKFFLQPLVENSILHGIQKREEGGYVGISAEEEDGQLIIRVWDNGVGIDEEKIERLLRGDTYEEKQKRHKHGIYNVNERLKMNYGEESALKFENRKNGGTKVTIRIPVEKLK